MTSVEESLFTGFLRETIHISPFLDFFSVFFAEYAPIIAVLSVLFFILKRRASKKEKFFSFLFIFLVILLSRGVFTELIRFFYPVPRPFEFFNFIPLFNEVGNSFPSGHAAVLFSIAFSLFLFSKKLALWFTVFSLVNGAARVYSGVHWPIDIIGGILVAVVSFVLLFYFLQPARNFINKTPEVSGRAEL